ncbi:FkbM family methyltransferase [Rhodovulum sp. 12E13]|uniref:FkbM family methyltransferase n=1 Tax=Rhodovulum sp. 12E13 TaxID=2203891 RepID=UPI000E1AA431|nr:FkbM family methyltransferase [Rhodovulum sp. 12E13]RDC73772.1 FkbM family methyltransferase [Rhodovulum sp. 12E13]
MEDGMSGRAPLAAGIGRSLRIYYGDSGRAARMDALYARFLRPGALAFDVGAHVGDRTACFRRLGARVVAVEPQPAALRALRLIHGRDAGVTLAGAAVGAADGRAALRVNVANPTVSTLSEGFVAAAAGAEGWQGQRWDRVADVPLTTLDALIAAHGAPDFVKVDVEGMEDVALAGLSRAVPALSFEVTTIHRGAALGALAQVAALGPYRFALSLGEGFDLPDEWVGAETIAQRIAALPDAANSGDVYAVQDGATLVPARGAG